MLQGWFETRWGVFVSLTQLPCYISVITIASAGCNSQCHTRSFFQRWSWRRDVPFLCWPVVSLGVRSYVGDYVEIGIYQNGLPCYTSSRAINPKFRWHTVLL
ncbi:hypothetical protein BC826DRAFT_518378 [Russula brevipes]|nr:hypothetical protein BC826DRAFT_518378 [Russula brevipes]